jgi:protein-S-isoprenylcysteine O-methyltransferase
MATVVLGVVILAGWLGLEVILRPPAASAMERTATDRSSTPLLVAGYVAAVVVPIALGATGIADVGDAAWLGVALGGAGLALRAWAMRTLGASYTRTLRTIESQPLVTAGPYRLIRHPGYLASLMVWVGAAIAFHSWIAALVVAVILGLTYAWRIRSEEQMLCSAFGPDYVAYAARTARLIPWLY